MSVTEVEAMSKMNLSKTFILNTVIVNTDKNFHTGSPKWNVKVEMMSF